MNFEIPFVELICMFLVLLIIWVKQDTYRGRFEISLDRITAFRLELYPFAIVLWR